jgi:hypothetical protein
VAHLTCTGSSSRIQNAEPCEWRSEVEEVMLTVSVVLKGTSVMDHVYVLS